MQVTSDMSCCDGVSLLDATELSPGELRSKSVSLELDYLSWRRTLLIVTIAFRLC